MQLWTGAPLADLAFEPFAQSEVPRLEEHRLDALEDRIDADLALGRHRELTAELGWLVARHPLRERMRGQLMLALYRSGRQADALAAYRDAHEYLVAELGLEPSRSLQSLEQAMLRQDDALDPFVTHLAVSVAPAAPRSPGRRLRQRRLLAGLVLGVLLLGCSAVLLALQRSSAAGRLVAADVQANAIVIADTAGLHLQGQQDSGGRPAGISIGAGSIWVTDAVNDRVLRVDRASRQLQDRIEVGHDPTGLVATRDGIWVADTGSGTVSQINPASDTVVATIRVGNAPTAVAAGAGAVWVADASDGTLRRIDPGTAAVVATIRWRSP